MKKNNIILLLAMFLSMTGINSYAVSVTYEGKVKVGDFYYSIYTKRYNDRLVRGYAHVAKMPSGKYSGVLSIPSYICYEYVHGDTYTSIECEVTGIGEKAFASCTNLTSITIPNSVESFEEGAFQDCTGLTSITIPNRVTSIGKEAFYNCKALTSVTIPNSVTTIGERAFRYCSGLTSVAIGNGVKSISEAAFSNCSGLTSVTIPNSVTWIGKQAFYKCSSLTSITIPNSVMWIDEEAFRYCSGLTSVTALNPTPVSIDSYTFSTLQKATLYVSKGSKSAYQTADYWKEFKEIVEIEVSGGESGGESGIDKIMSSENGKAMIFTIDGKRVDNLKKGMNVIRMKDGTIRKMVVK